MLRFIISRLFIFTAIYCLTAVLVTNEALAQKSSSEKARQKTSCKAGNISFTCPNDFVSLPVEPEQKAILLFHNSKRYGLLVVEFEPDSNPYRLVNDIAVASLLKFFPTEKQEFIWKYLAIPEEGLKSVSKYEVDGTEAIGFNGKIAVLFKHYQLKFKDKNFVIGYISEFGKGEEAKQRFEEDFVGDSMIACKPFVKLIYSITGEKEDRKNPPCILKQIIE